MTHLVSRIGMNLLLCFAVFSAIAAESEQTSPPDAVPPPSPATHIPLILLQHGGSGIVPAVDPNSSSRAPVGQETPALNWISFFDTSDPRNEFARRLKERLEDPGERAVLRAEQRAAIASQNAGFAKQVGLDLATEQKLIELLTDQQMETFEQMYRRAPGGPYLQQSADETTRQMDQLRDLLGDENLERFQKFQLNQTARD